MALIAIKLYAGTVSGASLMKKRAHQALAKPHSQVRVQLGRGRGSTAFLTTYFTAEYARINADYST